MVIAQSHKIRRDRALCIVVWPGGGSLGGPVAVLSPWDLGCAHAPWDARLWCARSLYRMLYRLCLFATTIHVYSLRYDSLHMILTF